VLRFGEHAVVLEPVRLQVRLKQITKWTASHYVES
jgi:hypothetical protein